MAHETENNTNDLRGILGLIKGLQDQINVLHNLVTIVDTSLQAQINILAGQTIAKARQREEEKEKQAEEFGLEGLHRMASGENDGEKD